MVFVSVESTNSPHLFFSNKLMAVIASLRRSLARSEIDLDKVLEAKMRREANRRAADNLLR